MLDNFRAQERRKHYDHKRHGHLTKDEREGSILAFQKYVEETDYPTVADFLKTSKEAWYFMLTRGTIESWPELVPYRQMAAAKQEAYVEEQALMGKIPPNFAIFKLKQKHIGWTDKQEIEHSGNTTVEHTFNPAIKAEFEDYLKGKDVIDVQTGEGQKAEDGHFIDVEN